MKKVPQMPTKGMPYLDYEQLFDGHAWKLEKEDFAGRDEKMVSAAIRNGDWITGDVLLQLSTLGELKYG